MEVLLAFSYLLSNRSFIHVYFISTHVMSTLILAFIADIGNEAQKN